MKKAFNEWMDVSADIVSCIFSLILLICVAAIGFATVTCMVILWMFAALISSPLFLYEIVIQKKTRKTS